MTIFGVPWEDLSLEDVEAFLATAGSEPLRWEAKGTDLPRPDSIAKHVCGFANAVDDGYILLGFERDGGGWSATGLDFPGDDPPVWVSTIVRDHLRPAPRVDVRAWPAGPKRAAVVRIEPVAEAPCMTSGGQVFERISGATVSVTDASDLRRLYERGQAAVARAEASAGRALLAVGLDEETAAPCHLLLGLALAPVGVPRDIGASLFTLDYAGTLKRLVDELPREPLDFESFTVHPPSATITPRQDAIVVAESVDDRRQSWNLRAAWDGSTAVRLRFVPARSEQLLVAETVFTEVIRPMAGVAAMAARSLGAYGRAHVILHASARQVSLHAPGGGYGRQIPGPGVLLPIQRWADDVSIDDHLLESVKREFLRACGIGAWEPGSDSDASG